MNVNEAKNLLITSRPDAADAEDPQIAEALMLAKNDRELGRWLEGQWKLQAALRDKFGQITPPAGLKEQILSEHAASRRMSASPRKALFAVVACLLLLGVLAIVWYPRPTPGDTLAVYQNEMVRKALGGYAMDLTTNDAATIRTYLAQNHAPADFSMPAGLQQAELTGCAAPIWEGAKVSLICFRTGKPLAPGESNDLWLFVVDRAAVKNLPETSAKQITIAKVNRLMTATWTDGNKLYFLGVEGQEADVQKYL